jgi:GT2 family glycosyltransferase
MQVSIVIVNWNTRDLLNLCLQSVKEEIENSGTQAEVFVVDNSSHDGSAEMVIQEHPWVILIANPVNRGFAAANNQALKIASGEKILLLNPDTEVRPGTLTCLTEFLNEHPAAGVVAPQLLNSDGSIQRSCRSFPTFLNMSAELAGLSKIFPKAQALRQYKMLDWDHDTERQVDQPEGACLLIRRETLEEAGLFDEGYFMLFEEVDWCYRVKKLGWEIWFTPAAQVVHHYGQSIKQAKAAMILSSHRGLYRFWHKHYRNGRWYLDPIAKMGLTALAYARVGAYKLKAGTGNT